MSMYQRIIKQLEQLAAKGPKHIEAVIEESPHGYIVGVPAEGKGAGASLRLEDFDRYSVMLRHLEVYDNSLVIDDDDREDYLRQCAAEITRRLTYLEEPLTLLELDAVEGVAQLRSGPPEYSDGDIIYWEMRIWSAPHPQVKLARYRWTANNGERALLLHPVTFVTLGRIAEDVAASFR